MGFHCCNLLKTLAHTFSGVPVRFHSFFVHPFYQAALTLLLVVVGGYGSIYSNEIRESFPFWWGPFGKISVPASIFWGLAFASLILFYCRNAAVEHAKTKDHETLYDSIRHAPRKEFLAEFAEKHRQISVLVEDTLGGSATCDNRDSISKAIRETLQIVAEFAQLMDGDYRAGRYAANIMVFIQVAELLGDEGLKDEVKKRLRFCDRDIGLENLNGVLDLLPELSAVADRTDDSYDIDLQAFALPIPKQAKTDDGRYRVGPGGPEAFVERGYSVFPFISEIHSWVREKADFKDEVIQEFDKYFTPTSKFQSFISIAVMRENLASECPIAVLNVHSDRPGLLTDAAGIKIQYCAPLLDPFIYPLYRLLKTFLELPSTHDAGATPSSEPFDTSDSTPGQVT